MIWYLTAGRCTMEQISELKKSVKQKEKNHLQQAHKLKSEREGAAKLRAKNLEFKKVADGHQQELQVLPPA